MDPVAAAGSDFQDIDSRFRVVGRVHVHYKRAGRGRPIVLLHGTGSSLATWDHIAAALAGEYDVVRVDLPGFGLTGPRADRDYTIASFVDVVIGFLDELELGPAVIVGNSLGGNIAWNLALDASDRVSALVLINATGYPNKELPVAMRLARNPVGRMVLRRAATRGGVRRSLQSAVGPESRATVTEELVDRVHGMMTRPGNQQAFIDLSRLDQRDRTHQLREITAPTLVLTSASVGSQGFGTDIADAREIVNPATGQLVPDEDPGWVVEQIGMFLDSLWDANDDGGES